MTTWRIRARKLDWTRILKLAAKSSNRLKRANGQLAGTINLIENGGHCREVVQQLAAVSKAIDRAGFLVIATAMRECMLDDGVNAEENRENLEKMFYSLA